MSAYKKVLAFLDVLRTREGLAGVALTAVVFILIPVPIGTLLWSKVGSATPGLMVSMGGGVALFFVILWRAANYTPPKHVLEARKMR